MNEELNIQDEKKVTFENCNAVEVESLFKKYCRPQIMSSYGKNKRNFASLSYDISDLEQEIRIYLMVILCNKKNLVGDQLHKYIVASVHYRLNMILFGNMVEEGVKICDRCEGKGFFIGSYKSEQSGECSQVINCLDCGGVNSSNPKLNKPGEGKITNLVSQSTTLNESFHDGSMLDKSMELDLIFDRAKEILTAKQYHIIEQFFYEKKNLTEIAEDLKMTQQNVSLIYHKALKKLKKNI